MEITKSKVIQVLRELFGSAIEFIPDEFSENSIVFVYLTKFKDEELELKIEVSFKNDEYRFSDFYSIYRFCIGMGLAPDYADLESLKVFEFLGFVIEGNEIVCYSNNLNDIKSFINGLIGLAFLIWFFHLKEGEIE